MFYSISVIVNNRTFAWLCPCICTTKTMPMPHQTRPRHRNHHQHHLSRENTHFTTQNSKRQLMVFTSYLLPSTNTTTMPSRPNGVYLFISNNSKDQTLVDTLEGTKWYVTPTILTTSIQKNIHMDNTTILIEQYFILLMPIHTCMQWIHLITIWHLISLTLDKQKLENHQQPIIPT